MKKPFKFTFPVGLITEPIIYQMGRKFDVITNIRRANVQEDMGWVILELEGTTESIKHSIQWVTSTGTRVDPIGGDVLEG